MKITDIKTAGSLFAGYGGSSIAHSLLGFKTILGVEINKDAQKILGLRFPDMEIHGDIMEFDAKAWKGKIDLLCGGFPCTDISVIGQLAGFKAGSKTASSLAWRMVQCIEDISPEYVFIENVDNILDKRFSDQLNALFDKLKSLGYGGRYAVYGSCDVGSPQMRNRFWLLLKKQSNPTITKLDIPEKLKSIKHGWQTPRVTGISGPKLVRGDGRIRDHTCDQLLIEDMRARGMDYTDAIQVMAHIGSPRKLFANIEWIESLMGFPIGWCNPKVLKPRILVGSDGKPRFPNGRMLKPHAWEPPYMVKGDFDYAAMRGLGNAQNPYCAKAIFEKLYDAINS